MATHSKRRTLDKAVALRKVHISIPTSREESKELEVDLRRMGCVGLLKKSWRVRREEMVRELVPGEIDQVYASTIRGRPDRWNVELWNRIYRYKQGGGGIATKKEDCTNTLISWTPSMTTMCEFARTRWRRGCWHFWYPF